MSIETESLHHDVFAIGEKLYCVWDNDLTGLNREFLNGVDHEYFNYLAETHAGALTGPNKLRAAIALRTAYFHGLETLFSLIFAGLHAWSSLPAWILKCQNEELRNLVASVRANQQAPNVRFRFEEYSWKSISAVFNGGVLPDNKERDRIVDDLGKLWALFAEDFTDRFVVAAHNSFKHGFRVRLGGMTISFKPAESPGNVVPTEGYQELAKSDFGLSFFVADKIHNAPNIKPDRHFCISHQHVNCHPEYAAASLRLIAISIHNVVAFLKNVSNGKKIGGLIPKGSDWFGELCKMRTGLLNFEFSKNISEGHIERFGDDNMQDQLNSRKVDIKITY